MVLDFRLLDSFSQFMRLNAFQIESLCKKIFSTLEQKQAVQFGQGRDTAYKKALEIITADYDRERALEDEVNRRIDDLERQQTEGFNRHQMFRMMKKKVAEEKGIVL